MPDRGRRSRSEQLEQKRDQLLAAIADDETQPQIPGRGSCSTRLVYGDHPFGRPATGKAEIVEKLTARRPEGVPRRRVRPELRPSSSWSATSTPTEMAKKVEKLTADWKTADANEADAAGPADGREGDRDRSSTDPTAAQTHVFIGHLGIKRNNPDYYKLLVMDNVLGTGPGFTDRLSATSATGRGWRTPSTPRSPSSASEQPGTFTGYIGTFPDKFIWVRDGFLKEINRIRDEPPTAPGSRGREEVPARQPAVPAWRPIGQVAARVARRRAVRAGVRRPGEVPAGSRRR